MSAPSRAEQFTPVGDGTPELDLVVGAGEVRVELADGLEQVEVTLTAGRPGGWQQRLGGMLAALGQVGDPGGPDGGDGAEDAAGAEALRSTEVAWAPHRHRLVVRTPQSGPLRSVPVEVVVRAPAGSTLRVRASSAGVIVTGRAGSVDVGSGSGRVELAAVGGRTDVRTGSGALRAASLEGPAKLRTGSGDVTVDALAGGVEVVTGSGDVRLGVGRGVLAELDVRTAGQARSDLEVLDAPPESEVEPVVLRVRTGSGDVVVHGAA
ncbi:DUF4097 family beta strand repeat-containing protein [Rhodococcus aerolatus]